MFLFYFGDLFFFFSWRRLTECGPATGGGGVTSQPRLAFPLCCWMSPSPSLHPLLPAAARWYFVATAARGSVALAVRVEAALPGGGRRGAFFIELQLFFFISFSFSLIGFVYCSSFLPLVFFAPSVFTVFACYVSYPFPSSRSTPVSFLASHHA
ncbi:hypothetical protein TRSC58_07245 [Trypanosoma rangeli SC58]|uniref:Uncharacterized protein n=1 Tax=Trypanosoma rangeli SC58 TaxID=429131 RepID=A0A061IRR3_TRYRA|nr:hypothetical protein TRSC58_07245 [Trypanosoma rangeli SC58]